MILGSILFPGAGANFSVFSEPGEINEFVATDTGTTSQSFELHVSGGVAPYTYLWEQLSGFTMTIDDPTDGITAFSYTGVTFDVGGIFRCTITDALGTAITYTSTVNLYRI